MCIVLVLMVMMLILMMLTNMFDMLLTQGGVWLSHSLCAEAAAPTV